MADTDDWRKPTTVYRSAYRRKPRSAKRGRRPPSAVAARFERMLADRKVIDSPVPPDMAIALRAETAISTYTRDYLLPSHVAAVADVVLSSRRRPPSTGRVATARPTACERPVAAPRTDVTYTGPAPPESYVPPRTEYWWTHGQLAGRAIAGGAVPKRIKRCQRINPTRIF